MGWHLLSCNMTCSDFETGDLFGSNFFATYRLQYNSSTLGSYKETPRLDWHETIMMNEHHKGESWVFETNMYTHNPMSNTLKVWPRRYIEAYTHAHGQAPSGKGHAILFDKQGVAVPAKSLAVKTDAKEQAEVTRNYLKSNGGILEIKIHDIPSINKPKTGEAAFHKERLLLFNVGVEGMGGKVQAFQYLDVNSAQPQTSWTRRYGLGWAVSGLKTSGLKKVPTPPGVGNPRQPMFFPGEIW